MKKKKIVSILLVCILFASVFLTGCNNGNFVAKFSNDVNEYNIYLTVNEVNHTVKASQETFYINNTDTTLENICFHLYPKSFEECAVNKPISVLYQSKAYPNGESFSEFNLTKVCVNGEEVVKNLEGLDSSILRVDLKEQLFPDEKVKISFEYEIKLPNINHRFGYGDNTINLGNFYPIACVYEKDSGFNKAEYHFNGDPFYSDIANYTVEVKNNEKYVVASSGKQVKCEVVENEKTTKIEAKAVRDFDVILSDKFSQMEKQVGSTKILYYYYNDQRPDESLKTAEDALNTFNDLFGKYPYETLSVVESNFVHGGMEYPNLVMISDCLEKYEDYQNTIVHEIAHQWWYGMVGSNEFNYGWLDEGLTEYSTALFYEQNESYGLKYDEIVKNANSSYCMFVDVYDDIFGKVDTSMNRKLNEYDTEPEYVYISYVKGMLLFDSLREVLGTKTFMKCLKNYFNTYKGNNVSPNELIASFEKTSLRRLENFFESWMSGKVIIAPKEVVNE
ncbi:MAG: M1 family metallopeptidase [Clostridiales bacterium]|nr:M1 family metallopeptidase [Candidatus Apopatousia equi]